MSKIIPSIYKIDLDKLLYYIESHELNSKNFIKKQLINNSTIAINAHELMDCAHNYKREQGLSSSQAFNLLQNGVQIVNDCQIAIYGTKSSQRPHEWQELFPERVGDLNVQRQNLAAFIAINDACYAISAGNGYTFFEQFIDTSFPLDIARRVMSPELDATTERAITGALYGRMQQFRAAQLIASSQNLGTVWQVIRGRVNEATLSSSAFQELFEIEKSRVNIEAGSSLKIRSSMNIEKLLALTEWLVKVLDTEPTAEQVEEFQFLDSLKEISPRKNAVLVDKLYEQLCSDILCALIKGKGIDLDFSHQNFNLFQTARQYEFDEKSLNTGCFPCEIPPTATEVLNHLYHNGFSSISTPNELKDYLEKISFCATHDDEIDTTKSSVLGHIHGEARYDGRSYFLVDGRWYIADSDFINRVANDFVNLLDGEFFKAPSDLSLALYDLDKCEGVYNESYVNGSLDWVTTDRVFMQNVEIADIISVRGDTLYIVHNKNGFNVTIRDACSQVLHSMNILNQVRAMNNNEVIGKYYDCIQTKYYKGKTVPIGRQDFIDRLLKTDSSKIVYVLGYAAKKPVDSFCESNIAKFESVKLCQTDRRAFDFGLKIVHLEPKK